MSDFETLPAGDDTEIGPRGINISGGQKARVALSRALFGASAKVVLLDDVLSAVDVHVAHVARRIVDEVLLGSLRDKTRVLVANTFLPLLLPSAHMVVVLGPQGNIDVVGSPAEALSASDWLRDAVASMGGCVLTDAADLPPQDLQHFALGDEAPVTQEPSNALSVYRARTDRVLGVEVCDGSLLVAEDRVVGALNVWAYTAFFREATSKKSAPLGSAIFAFVLILVLARRGVQDNDRCHDHSVDEEFWRRGRSWSWGMDQRLRYVFGGADSDPMCSRGRVLQHCYSHQCAHSRRYVEECVGRFCAPVL